MTIFQNHERLALHEPLFSKAGDFLFLTVKENDRIAIATTIERLIDTLDAMEPDCDLEPSIGGFLGGGTAHEEREADYTGSWGRDGIADDEPCLGAPERHPDVGWGRENKAVRREHSQDDWATGEPIADDREEECEDEGAQCEDEGAATGDDEYSLGWPLEDNQTLLRGGDGDYEADLSTTDEVDQDRRLQVREGWMAEDGEPDLGFVGIATGWREGEDVQCREADQLGDDQRELDHAESGIADDDALQSQEFLFAGWTGDGSGNQVARGMIRKHRGASLRRAGLAPSSARVG